MLSHSVRARGLAQFLFLTAAWGRRTWNHAEVAEDAGAHRGQCLGKADSGGRDICRTGVAKATRAIKSIDRFEAGGGQVVM